MNLRFLKLITVSVIITVLFACNANNDKPAETDRDFTPYISGYTFGDRISKTAAIQIELAQEFDKAESGTEIKENLLSFTPSVKGKTYWKNKRTIEFLPDEPLKEGTAYKVTFNLGKVLPKLEKGLQTFSFEVHTIEQDFSIKEAFYRPIHSNQNRWNSVTVEFETADAITDDEAQSVFSAKLDGKAVTTVRLESSSNGVNFKFIVDSLERTSADQTLKLICDGKAIGSKKVTEEEIVIHALNTEIFKVVNAQNCAAPEKCIQIIFTDPLRSQDLKGLVELENFKAYTMKTDKNVLKLYPENNFPEVISGRVDKRIRSFAGKILTEDFTFNLNRAPDIPVVRLLHTGTIMPDSKNIIIPFSAINLRAVEMRIIKVYEHNVLFFLQENSFDGTNNLTRTGRIIAKKLLRLDHDKSKVLTNWNTYAVDLSALVAKEPGAIYRIELIIRQPFSLYPCEDAPLPEEIESALDESNFTLTDKDFADWNSRYYSDYSPIEYNWDSYDWRKRDDPCNPTFYMRSEKTVASTNLFATNVGVIAKRGDGTQIFISAQDIRTTEPLASSRVRILNNQLAPIAAGTTDRNGFCKLSVKHDDAFIAEVTHGGQKGYLKIRNGNELSLSRFDVGGKAIRKGLKGFIYGERGVWRPGDEIFMTFILEDRQKSIPREHPVTMDIYNPQGQFYRKLVNTNPVGNFYTFSFKTEENSPTGMWHSVVKVGGTEFGKSFRIETIKPNRLKINVDFGTELIEKNEQKMTVDAKWLHGAIAKELATKVLLKLSSAASKFKGYEAYSFNNPAANSYTHEEQIYSGKLDENGKTEFTAKIPEAQGASGMLTATFITTVEESGGGESMTINSLPYSPFPAYVGLNTHLTDGRDILSTDTAHYFDVAMVDARGRPVKSGELVYKAYKLEWSWWYDVDNRQEKLASVINGNHIKPVIDQKVTVKDGKARIVFKRDARDWGRYLIFLKDPKGGHAAGQVVFADSPYWGSRSRQGDPQGLTMLSFTTDKPSYTVGEDVKITLGKAGNGRALVSLENGSQPIKQWWVETKAGEPTLIQFKVTEDLTPNFYVHITMLQQHHQTVNDLPIRLYGVAPVTVSHPLGELKPTISMPDVLRSEKEFTINISEANRQHMTYTLAIVDEGLLDISNFKTPNPYAEFNVKEALGVKTFDRYNDVIGAFAGELKPLFSIGGGEDLNPDADKNSQRFKPVVKFLGPFELKAGASDRHNIKLPPYIGSVRVMVVAANDKQAYGRAEKAVPVQNPLMVLTTLPRVLGPGEDVLMPVNLFVMDKAIRNVKVDVKTSGLLELQEGASKNVTIKETGDQIIYFKTKTKKLTGKVQVTVTASSGKEVSSETIDIEIRNPNPPLTIFKSYAVKPSDSVSIDYEFDEELPDNQVKLEYARIPSVNLNSSLQYLIGYPHGCAEQIISQAFPQLFLHNFSNLSSKQKQEIQTNVNSVIEKLYTLQTADGGIAYWSGSSQVNEWVTSYAGHFMAVAKDQGYNISRSFINNWKKYQKRRVNSWNSGRYTDDVLQSYRLYSMAVMGETDLAAMNRFRQRLHDDFAPSHGTSFIANWQLAAAYALSGRKDAARQMVLRRNTNVNNYSAFNTHFGSAVRDEAIILETLILLDDMEQALKVARRISEYLNGSNYTTQTTAWALMAMARFAGKSGQGDMEFTVSHLGKTKKIETADPVYTEDLTPLKKSGRVLIKNNGSANIYIGRTMISTPLEDRSSAVSNNLRLQVSYTGLENKSLDVTKLTQGTDFTATVSVTNTGGAVTYTNLALTHIIPSGWEIFNTRLANEEQKSDSAKGITYQDIRDDRVLSYFDLAPSQTKTVTVRLQAAYLGRFFMPAIACQAMYDNTVYARGTGHWVEIVKQ